MNSQLIDFLLDKKSKGLRERGSLMKRGDLVYHKESKDRFYVVLNVKKYYYNFKDRVKAICPTKGIGYWFVKEDLEVLNECW